MNEILMLLGIIGGILFMMICVKSGRHNKQCCVVADKPKRERPTIPLEEGE